MIEIFVFSLSCCFFLGRMHLFCYVLSFISTSSKQKFPWQVDHVAHCHMNFQDRAQWDKQMDGFKVLCLGDFGCFGWVSFVTYLSIEAHPLT